jgi:hypothetical protein
MNRVAKIGLGCLLLPIGTVVLGLIFFLSMKAAGVPDPSPKDQTFAQEIGTRLEPVSPGTGTSLERSDDVTNLSRQAAAASVIVDIEAEECMFYLESGPAEDGVRVEATYDEATYELTKTYDLEGDAPVFKLEFKSKISFWRRIAQDGTFQDNDIEMNEITVFLPENTPIALRTKVSKAECEMLLDDLVLTEFVTEGSMGEYTVTMDTPNPVTMDAAVIKMSMGAGSFRGLSNLRAKSLTVDGGMGELRIDFGNSLLVDTDVYARMRMGEMSIEVPDDALYDSSSKVKATVGEVNNGMRRGQRIEDPELARRLTLDAAVLMGEIRLDPFRVRPSSRMSDR